MINSPERMNTVAKKQKRLGDRYDATWVRNCDPMHGFMPYLYINRADNEAFIQEEIDLGPLNEFLKANFS